MNRTIKIAVVGGGINGISCALRILETPFSNYNVDVSIIAENFSPNTTSDCAAGYLHPYLSGEMSDEQLKLWSQETFDYCLNLLTSPDASSCGVGLLPVFKLAEEPIWDKELVFKDVFLDLREMTKKELNMFPRKYRYGVHVSSIYAECTKLLPYLTKSIKGKGGKFITKKLDSLRDLMGIYDVVVNCCGVEAAHLVSDPQVLPIRGQTIRVKAPWVKCSVTTKDNYILINSDDIVCGGTSQRGNWNTEPDPKDRDFIWKGCCELIPSLKSAEIVKDCVGLRPGRNMPRLERETLTRPCKSQKLEVIHNYGHGGSGVTLFWGCAKDVVEHVRQILHEKSSEIENSNLKSRL